ncbi:7477_t:CDS:1, partial [Ambispora gerdemannii]
TDNLNHKTLYAYALHSGVLAIFSLRLFVFEEDGMVQGERSKRKRSIISDNQLQFVVYNASTFAVQSETSNKPTQSGTSNKLTHHEISYETYKNSNEEIYEITYDTLQETSYETPQDNQNENVTTPPPSSPLPPPILFTSTFDTSALASQRVAILSTDAHQFQQSQSKWGSSWM